jgi:hypothetical protein
MLTYADVWNLHDMTELGVADDQVNPKFTCFTSTKVQVLTLNAVLLAARTPGRRMLTYVDVC